MRLPIFLRRKIMKKFGKVIALGIAVIMCVALLVACAPNFDPDKAKKALEDNGYAATKVSPNVSVGGLEINLNKDVDCIVSGTKIENDKAEHVTIYYYTSAKAASEAWEDMQKEADKEKGDEEDSDWVCKKSGKMIYFGTKAAVKAAK